MIHYSACLIIFLLFPFYVLAEKDPSPQTQVSSSGDYFDKLLSAKRIFVLPIVDNIGGASSKELNSTLIDFLKKDVRFRLIKNQNIIKVLKPKGKDYKNLLKNISVRARVASVSGADVIVYMELNYIDLNVEIRQDWYTANGELLFSEKRTILANELEARQKELVVDMTRSIVKKVPFDGSITGRSDKLVTLDLSKDQIKEGDLLDVVQIASEKRHPLLKTLVGVNYLKLGSIRIVSADKILSFADIVEEKAPGSIRAGNKVIVHKGLGLVKKEKHRKTEKKEKPLPPIVKKIEEPALEKQVKVEESPKALRAEGPREESRKIFKDKRLARYGSVRVQPLLSNLRNVNGVNDVSTRVSGFSYGGSFLGELWVTKNWIFGLEYDFTSGSVKGNRGQVDFSASGVFWDKTTMLGGYRIFLDDQSDGTILFLAGGFQAININFPTSTVFRFGQRRYSGVFLRFSSGFYLNKKNRVDLSLDFQPFSSLVETGVVSGEVDNAAAVSVSAGWSFLLKHNLFVGINFSFESVNGSFESGSTISNRRFSFYPGIIYLF